MPVRMIRFGGEVVVDHYLTAYERFQGKGGEHVEAEAAASLISGLRLFEGVGRKEKRWTHNRAMFTMMLSVGKLLRMLPWVLSPKVRNPDSAMTKHAIMEIPVEK